MTPSSVQKPKWIDHLGPSCAQCFILKHTICKEVTVQPFDSTIIYLIRMLYIQCVTVMGLFTYTLQQFQCLWGQRSYLRMPSCLRVCVVCVISPLVIRKRQRRVHTHHKLKKKLSASHRGFLRLLLYKQPLFIVSVLKRERDLPRLHTGTDTPSQSGRSRQQAPSVSTPSSGGHVFTTRDNREEEMGGGGGGGDSYGVW